MPVILESIATTVSASGEVNIAPLGPQITEDPNAAFILRPFAGSTTYANLLATRCAVIHVTDDVLLLARSAIGKVSPDGLGGLLNDGRFWRLHDCHRYFAIEAVDLIQEEPKATLRCRVVESGEVRPFFGLSRAKHAVIEAAITATRVHLIPENEVRDQMRRLRPLIDKTGGDNEYTAFRLLQEFIEERLANHHGTA